MERSLALSVVAAFLAGCAGGSSPSPSAALAQSASRSQVVPPASSDLVPARHQKRCAASSGGSGILPDGDFSRATDPRLGGGDQIVFQGQEFAPSWKVSKGNIDFLATTYSEWHPNGLCSVDLDGYRTAGGIEHRAFATSSGASYTVSFTMSGNGDGPPRGKDFKSLRRRPVHDAYLGHRRRERRARRPLRRAVLGLHGQCFAHGLKADESRPQGQLLWCSRSRDLGNREHQ